MQTQLKPRSAVTQLICSQCNKSYDWERLQTFATCCNKPLLYNYELQACSPTDLIDHQENSMWRYASLLPLSGSTTPLSLGEGNTPLLQLSRLGSFFKMPDLWMKDEGQNPTGSFKARGLAMAVSMARYFGVERCIIPTAGNAGGAMSAYCAQAGIEATVVMPEDAPTIFRNECKALGARVITIPGLISDCGEMANRLSRETGALNLATMKEPFRLEGKKTMGFEIAEQMNWELPDVIVYPTGGGTGMIGIWKALQEMGAMGWIEGGRLPKMVAVQSTNCAPVADRISGRSPGNYKNSFAAGLAVPKPFALDLIEKVIVESQGHVTTVSEGQIREGMVELGSFTGVAVAPEGAAAWMGLKQLVNKGLISSSEKILLLNTGSGLKVHSLGQSI